MGAAAGRVTVLDDALFQLSLDSRAGQSDDCEPTPRAAPTSSSRCAGTAMSVLIVWHRLTAELVHIITAMPENSSPRSSCHRASQ